MLTEIIKKSEKLLSQIHDDPSLTKEIFDLGVKSLTSTQRQQVKNAKYNIRQDFDNMILILENGINAKVKQITQSQDQSIDDRFFLRNSDIILNVLRNSINICADNSLNSIFYFTNLNISKND